MAMLMDTAFWLITAILSLLMFIAVGLLLVPRSMHRLSSNLDHWYSLRSKLSHFERPYYPEHGLYRHHRFLGLLLVVGAGYTLLRLPAYDTAAIAELLPLSWPLLLRTFIIDAMWPFLLISNLCALLIGMVIYLRPSLLRQAEHAANRWLSTRRALKPLDTPHDNVNSFLWRYPRLVGLFLLLGCLYIASIFALFPGLLPYKP